MGGDDESWERMGVESQFWVAVTPRGWPEKAMAPHSSTLAWKIPWTEETAVHGVTRSWTQLSDFTFPFHFHALEKAMATHSSVLAWRIPGMGSLVAAIYGVAQSQTRLKWLGGSSSTWTADTQRLCVMTPASSAGGAACWLRGVGVAEWLRPACSLKLPLGFLRNLSHSDLDGLDPQDKSWFWTSNYWGLFSSLERNIDSQV